MGVGECMLEEIATSIRSRELCVVGYELQKYDSAFQHHVEGVSLRKAHQTQVTQLTSRPISVLLSRSKRRIPQHHHTRPGETLLNSHYH